MFRKRKRIYLLVGMTILGLAVSFLFPSIEESSSRSVMAKRHSFSPLSYTKTVTPDGAIYQFGDYALEVTSATQNSSKLIICLPILSGEKVLPDYFAKAMFRGGYDTAIIHRNRKLHDNVSPENLNICLKWLIDSHCTLINEFSAKYDKIGIIGVSLGGIVGTLITGHCENVDSLVSIVSGQNLSRVLIESNDRGILKVRNELLKNCTVEELSDQLDIAITYDPRDIADSIDPEQVLMVLARYDKTVPYQYGLELKGALGHPKTITLPATHFSGLLYLPYVKNKALSHFRNTL